MGSLPQRLVLAKTSDNVIQEFDIALILAERSAKVVLGARLKLACERFGKLDVLVNNAGIAPTSLLDELRVEGWEEMVVAAALPCLPQAGVPTCR